MKIDKVIGEEIKGHSFEHALADVNIVTGGSFTGKTAVLDAVRVSLLGYHPKLGKRPRDTFKLCRGTRMHTAVHIGERVVARTWQLQRDSVTASGAEDAVVPPVLLDCREYFGMSGPERMRFVFQQIDFTKQFKDDTLFARLRGLKPKTSTEHTEAAITECVEVARTLTAARDQEGVTIPEWIEAILDKLREQKKLADAAVKQMTGLQQGTAQLRTGTGSDAMPAANREAEITAMRQRLGKLQGEVAVIMQAKDRVFRHERRVKDLTTLLEAPDPATRMAEIRTELAVLEPQVKQFKTTMPDLIRKTAELSAGIKQVEREVNNRTQQMQELERDLLTIETHKQCPYCGTNKQGWQDTVRREHLKRVADLKAKAVAGLSEVGTLRKLLADAMAKHADAMVAERQHKERGDRMAELLRELATLTTTAAVRESYANELKLLQDSAPSAGDEARLAGLRDEVRRLDDTELVALDAEHRRWVAAKATEGQALAARERGLQQTARAEVFKLAVEEVAKLQQEMIDGAIGGLMAVANQFTVGIMRAPLQYRDGDIGYMHAGQWVSHETFSGTEEALAYAGLSVALAAEAELKLVMIDELGVADPVTKHQIVSRMIKLIEDGVIAQFIGADVSSDYTPRVTPPTINVIKAQ